MFVYYSLLIVPRIIIKTYLYDFYFIYRKSTFSPIKICQHIHRTLSSSIDSGYFMQSYDEVSQTPCHYYHYYKHQYGLQTL